MVTLLCSLIHVAAHIARVFFENNLEGLYSEQINLSGLVATPLLLPVVVPMMIGYLKNRVRARDCCLRQEGRLSLSRVGNIAN